MGRMKTIYLPIQRRAEQERIAYLRFAWTVAISLVVIAYAVALIRL